MSTQTPWQPTQRRDVVQASEVLESPRRRRSTVLLAATALLVGMGLGNVYGSTGRDLDETREQLQTVTGRLASETTLRGEAAATGEEYLRQFTEASSRSTITEEGLIAMARLSALGRLGSGHASVVEPGAGAADTFAAWVDAHNAGRPAEAREAFARDATATFVQNGVQTAGTRGALASEEVSALLAAPLVITSDIQEDGDFAVASFVRAGTTGVVALRSKDGRITHLWVALDGTW